MNNAVGKHIGKLRRELGLSQEQLAEKLSVTRQAVSNWETGRTQPSLEMLEALAKAFEVDLLTVIYGQPPVTEDTAAKAAARKRHLLLAVIWALTTAMWTAIGLRIMPVSYTHLLGGKVMLAGVPAEECLETEWRRQEIEKGHLHFLGGKAELLYRGAFEGVDLVISMHAGLGNDGTITTVSYTHLDVYKRQPRS